MRTIRLRLHVPNKPASDVYQTLADFERYPELSDAVQSVAVTEVSENRTVSQWEVTFRAGLLCWTEEDTFDPGARPSRSASSRATLPSSTARGSASMSRRAARSCSQRGSTWASRASPTRWSRSRCER